MLLGLSLLLMISLALFQAAYVFEYSRRLRRPKRRDTEVELHPPATIVLCLRGTDPSLHDCLNSIYRQAYLEYRVVIVFDSEQDPSYQFVADFLSSDKDRSDKTDLLVLEEHHSFGSLKCQAICAAATGLSKENEVLAFIDADSIVDENWLHDLVNPFSDPEIGATTGNRFFQPQEGNLGSKLREVWNSAAIVQMALYQIAWGGSFAIRTSLLEDTDIVSRWGKAFCEDTMLESVLQRYGFRLHRVSNLVVCNRESTTILSAYRWIVRQLLTSRLYVRWWPMILTHALLVGATFGISLFTAFYFAALGEWKMLLLISVSIVLYQAVNLVLLSWITALNKKLLRQRNQRTSGNRDELPSPNSVAFHLVAMLLSQLVQPLAAIHAAIARTVRWRGINYSIQPRNTISMDKYVPFVAEPKATNSVD